MCISAGDLSLKPVSFERRCNSSSLCSVIRVQKNVRICRSEKFLCNLPKPGRLRMSEVAAECRVMASVIGQIGHLGYEVFAGGVNGGTAYVKD